MRVIHAFNVPRSGSGSTAASLATIAALRDHEGVETQVFSRSSRELPAGFAGRARAGVSAFYPAGAVRDFRQALASFRPDLVHVNELFPLISPWILRACREAAVPVVMTIDDYHPTCPIRSHFRDGHVCTECLGGREWRAVANNCRGSLAESSVNALYNAMVRKLGMITGFVDQFISPSDFTGGWAVRHAGVPADRMSTVNPAVRLPPAPSDAGAGSYIAFAGRFVPEKGVHVLLEAARRTSLPVRLSRSAAHSASVELPPDVEVVITRDRDELDAFYRGARMLVVPSIWFDSFPTVGLEAMAHGIPVIGSRIGGLPEIVAEGVDGELFEAGNAAELASKAAALWADPPRCRAMGAAARAKALARWGAASHARGVMQVYERALRGRRAAASP
ncbi:MAG TPA: glycosyltransferase [Usitatibacter sp.]|nr:glycosyltransferase [Usitatibacter sp.]